MDTLLIVVVLVLVVVCASLVVLLFRERKAPKDDVGTERAIELLFGQLNDLGKTVRGEMHELSKVVDSKIGESSKLVHDSVRHQFGESQKLIQEITRELTEVKETGKRVGTVAEELRNLQDVLKNPKQRGVLGEYYLETVLKNVLPPERYATQYKFADGETVDAVIFLDKNRMLPIDSKFSLENYNRIIETTDQTERERLEKLFKQDLKNRIDETAKYIRPNENTMEFAFMFIPSEGIYYDLLINQVGAVKTSARDLIEYAFQQKKVIIVSPTSFMAYLQTVLQGLKSLEIEEKAKTIIKNVGELGRHLAQYDTYHQKLGANLGTVVNQYNLSSKEFKKIDKDILRISGDGVGIDPEVLEKPETEG